MAVALKEKYVDGTSLLNPGVNLGLLNLREWRRTRGCDYYKYSWLVFFCLDCDYLSRNKLVGDC
jgi:hypothetical protein